MPPKYSLFQNSPENDMPPKHEPTHLETTASTSVTVADRLIPPDIVFEILSRLPVKYVLRFKCVCKDWHKITSSELFISAHLSRSPSSLLTHAMEMNCRRYSMRSVRFSGPQLTVDRIDDFPGSDAVRYPNVIGMSCLKVIGSLPNGVVCVSQNLFSDKLILWNPSTRSTRPIIAPKLIPDPDIHAGASIGVAYDPSRDDIKIVRMLCHRDFATPNVVEFYSHNSGEWKIMKPNEIPKFCVTGLECETVVEGVPYWRCLIKDENLVQRNMLLSFLPNEGGFAVESIDRILEKRCWAVCMGEFMGRLAAASWGVRVAREGGIFQALYVWSKCEDSVWRKIAKIKMPGIGRVLGFHGGTGVVQEIFENECLVLVDLQKKDVTPFFMYRLNRVAAGGCFKVVTFKESLTQIPEAGRSLKTESV